MEQFLNPLEFSHVSIWKEHIEGQAPDKNKNKQTKNLEGDWMYRLSITFKRTNRFFFFTANSPN